MVTVLFTSGARTYAQDTNEYTYSSLIYCLEKMINHTDLKDGFLMVSCSKVKSLCYKLQDQGLEVDQNDFKMIYK